MKLASIAIIVAGGLMSQSAVAIEKMYGVVSAGYTDLEYSNTVEESFGYKLILGHEFHRQWLLLNFRVLSMLVLFKLCCFDMLIIA